jgi:hypothetical protein
MSVVILWIDINPAFSRWADPSPTKSEDILAVGGIALLLLGLLAPGDA